MKINKQRVDILLVEKGHAKSREEAKKMVMAGCVYVANEKIIKSSTYVSSELNIEVKNFEKEFVSRGGYKLKKALSEFSISVNGLIAADIGASTGGFTDCLLKNEAKKVYAVDTGYGQLDWKLRNDNRVEVLERLNARFLKTDSFNEKIDFVTIDVSFISLKLIFPAVINILKKDGDIVCLIKPQFEAGRDKVGKKGVVREKSTHIEVIKNVIGYAKSNKLNIKALSFSPIKGPNGNIEYLLYLTRNEIEDFQKDIKLLVDNAWSNL